MVEQNSDSDKSFRDAIIFGAFTPALTLVLGIAAGQMLDRLSEGVTPRTVADGAVAAAAGIGAYYSYRRSTDGWSEAFKERGTLK